MFGTVDFLDRMNLCESNNVALYQNLDITNKPHDFSCKRLLQVILSLSR